MMEITSIKIESMESSTKCRGTASIVFDNSFVVNNIRIIETEKDHYIAAMPSHQNKKTCKICVKKNNVSHMFCSECGYEFDNEILIKYHDTCHPITSRFRRYLEQAIVLEFLNKSILG